MKVRGEEDRRQRGNWEKLVSVEERLNLRQQIYRFRKLFKVTFMFKRGHYSNLTHRDQGSFKQ